MNKSVMKCCICNNENIGQFITINNKKYHLCCIEQLHQENKQLKEKLDCDLQWAFKYDKQVDNWNKLKKWIYEEHCLYIPEIARNSTYQVVLDKMQEL